MGARAMAADKAARRQVPSEQLDASIASATRALISLQKEDGHFVFELEADATIPAEYVLMRHYLGEPVDLELEAKIAAYLRRIQSPDGGWPLFHEGPSHVSASVKGYFGLKMIGDRVDAPHMVRARQWILVQGGAAKQQRLHPQPARPIRRHSLARGPGYAGGDHAPAAVVSVPPRQDFLLGAHGAGAAHRSQCREAASAQPKGDWHRRTIRHAAGGSATLAQRPASDMALVGDFRRHRPRLARCPQAISKTTRKLAIEKARRFVTERLNGDDGLGAIFPAMANSVFMFDALGYPSDHPDLTVARSSVQKLLVVRDDEAYCQPCLSPVWDTALATHALLEVGGADAEECALRGLEWLKPLQVLDTVGDWAATRPGVLPGGWAFQYANPHYPDLDDTAVVVMAMDRASKHIPAALHSDYQHAMDRGRMWVECMQSKNGGWGAFDADNTHHYLNQIPFSDHGALLDPPTADVTALPCWPNLATYLARAQCSTRPSPI